jgi:serine/threonine protein phosphatase PrpC
MEVEATTQREALKRMQTTQPTAHLEQEVARERDQSSLERMALKDLELVPRDKLSGFCLKVGAYTLGGKKAAFPSWENQDAYLALPLPGDFLLAAVFDGHGLNGHHAAARARDLFHQLAPLLIEDLGPAALLRQLFEQCEMLLQQEGLCRLSGTTATAAIVDQRQSVVTVAHVGDSTMVVFKDNAVVFATQDHQVDEEAELRIVAHGGEVRPWAPPADNVLRVFAPGMKWPGLSMARALGDTEAKKLGVIAEPDVSSAIVLEAGTSIVLASDGVWETLPRDVAAARMPALSATELAQTLVLDARSRWPQGEDIDDITMVVINVSSAQSLDVADRFVGVD